MLPVLRKEREKLSVAIEKLGVNIELLENCIKVPVVGVPRQEDMTSATQER